MTDRLKFASRLLIEENGGLEAAALITRIGKTRLQQCISDEKKDSYLPIDVVLQLERSSSIAHVTNLMIEVDGERNVKSNDYRVISDFTEFSARFARVIEEYNSSLEDDSKSTGEKPGISSSLLLSYSEQFSL